MPRALRAIRPRTPVIEHYDDPTLGPTDIRIRTDFASPKHGTELVGYRNEPSANRPYDPVYGAVRPRPVDGEPRGFPRGLGNMATGTVSEVGSDVSRFSVGDRVFGHFPIRETQTVDQASADAMPAGLTDEAAVCLDPAVMAFAIRDGGIKLGDTVAVFGLGAIGLMTIQLAKLAGASRVIALDPIAPRRDVAQALGADVVLDPTAGDGDAGMAVRQLDLPDSLVDSAPRTRLIGGYSEQISQYNNLGVDVAIETSGNTLALNSAIRATRFGGTVCMVSFYGRDATGVYLGDEFHVNRLQMVSVRAESLPMRDAPGWNLDRMVRTSLDWLATGRIRTDGIITPIVSFEDSAEAYREIDEHPERSIKLGIRFD
ncbi:MAG TPA: zinc-binding alcohol dehydrogenase [Thermomicrobiales bacterium]|nr:zinc-binding alcohol dehydrogenase [Thermomicrobiales bacterium]